MRRVIAWIGTIIGLVGASLTRANLVANYLGFLSLPDDVREALTAMSHIPTVFAGLLLVVGVVCIVLLLYDYGLLGWVQQKFSATKVPLHAALCVGHFWADFTQIKERLRLGINLVLLNQTDQTIVIEGVHGNIAPHVADGASSLYLPLIRSI